MGTHAGSAVDELDDVEDELEDPDEEDEDA
jgi:hypothetical protein